MLHAAPLSTPEDVAWFLASYARDARSRIENVDLPALSTIRKALEEALGLKFEGDKGEHFFSPLSSKLSFMVYFPPGFYGAKRIRLKLNRQNLTGSRRFGLSMCP